MTTRKNARLAVAALLESMSEFAAVYPYEIDGFDGQTPVAMVHSDGTITSDPPSTFGCLVPAHSLLVHIFVKRNPPQSENDLDDLSESVYALLESNFSIADYDGLITDDEYSTTDHIMMIESIHYRHEVIRIIVW